MSIQTANWHLSENGRWFLEIIWLTPSVHVLLWPCNLKEI